MVVPSSTPTSDRAEDSTVRIEHVKKGFPPVTTSSIRMAKQTIRDAVRAQLWPLPVIGVAVAVALGILMPLLDGAVDTRLTGLLNSVIFGGDAGAARTVLSAVSSSLITVTSLTFSLTVVTLQLASSQFSPRLLRTFTQDLFVQVTLAVFLATFTFALTVLRSVRSAEEGGAAFVPRLSTSLAFLLAVASVVALVLFLAHLTRQIRVETMFIRVYDDAVETIRTNLSTRDQPQLQRPTPAGPGTPLWARGSGFLTTVDQDELVDAATEAGTVITIDRQPGAFVVEGTPLGRIWFTDSDTPGSAAREALERRIQAAVHLGPERTAAQDIGLGLRQLTDIVTKALSPGVNDPTTAVHGLGRSSVLVSKLMSHHLGPLVLAGSDHQVRVTLDRPDFAELLELTVAQPRWYGKSDPCVLAALYKLVTDLAWHAGDEHRETIAGQLRRLDATVAEQDFDPVEVTSLNRLSREAEQILRG